MISCIAGEVLGDVDLVWANCRSFNEPDSEICDLADQAQQALRMRWQQEGLPTVTPIPPCAKKQKKDGKKRALDAGGSSLLKHSWATAHGCVKYFLAIFHVDSCLGVIFCKHHLNPILT